MSKRRVEVNGRSTLSLRPDKQKKGSPFRQLVCPDTTAQLPHWPSPAQGEPAPASQGCEILRAAPCGAAAKEMRRREERRRREDTPSGPLRQPPTPPRPGSDRGTRPTSLMPRCAATHSHSTRRAFCLPSKFLHTQRTAPTRERNRECEPSPSSWPSPRLRPPRPPRLSRARPPTRSRLMVSVQVFRRGGGRRG